MGVKRAKITCDVSGNHKTLKVDGAGEWDMDAIEDGNGNVAKCEYHPLAINPGFPVEVSKTNKQAYSDYGQNWSPKPDRVGLSGPFHTHHNIKKLSIKKESNTLLFLIVLLVNLSLIS